MRRVAEILAEQPDDGDEGPEPMTYRELAAIIYGNETPTHAQRESVGRACRKLCDAGHAASWTVPRQVDRWSPYYPMVHGIPLDPIWERSTVYVREGAVTRPLNETQQAAYEKRWRNAEREKAMQWLVAIAQSGTALEMEREHPDWVARMKALAAEPLEE